MSKLPAPASAPRMFFAPLPTTQALSVTVTAGGGGDTDEDDEMALISSGMVSSPVDSVDITIPSGYSKLKLVIEDAIWLNGEPACGFSLNGSSYLGDTEHSDSYLIAIQSFKTSGDGVTDLSESFGYKAAFPEFVDENALSNAAGNFGFSMVADIAPGNTSSAPTADAKVLYSNSDGAHIQLLRDVITLNPTATIPPTFARLQKLRLFDGDSGDTNAPTPDGVVALKWWLFGLADPA